MVVSNITEFEKSIEILRNNPDIIDKQKIARTYEHLSQSVESSIYFPKDNAKILLGDDTAAIRQNNGSHLLFAAEGIVSHFLNKDPWFAGYSAIMVNISDVCAMGGLPIAVTDTLFSKNTKDGKEIWEGMLAASQAYGVPIVGGHTCYNSEKALSVSILGKATENILSSFTAKPGDALLLAIDQNGAYYKEYAFWNASTTSSSEHLQKIVQLPKLIANKKLSTTAKDVSMGGIIGTICMLLNTSKVGAEVYLKNITKPEKVSWDKWLSSFPSYGYLLTCSSDKIKEIQSIFNSEEINCDHIGTIIPDEKDLWINHKNQKLKF